MINHAKVAMRTSSFDGSGNGSAVSIRLLEGFELMQVTGFDFATMFTDTGEGSVDGNLVTSLAGNAFNGFAVGVASSCLCL